MPAKKKPPKPKPKTFPVEFDKRDMEKLEEMSEKAGPLMTLYDLAAIGLRGKRANKNENYDCKKIEVSRDIADALIELLQREGHNPHQAALAILVYGPKLNENLPEQTVRVEPGFIQKI